MPAANAQQSEANTPAMLVGMWHTVYFLGNTQTRYARVARSVDPDGNPIPALDADGGVRSTRISVE